MPFFPDWTIVTACIPGCSSRISWEYDDGEPMTRDYPGYPPEVYAVLGCSPEHLIRASDEATLVHDAWQRVQDYDRWVGASHLSWISSLQYIAGPGSLVTLDNRPGLGHWPRRQIRVPVRPVWEHDDDDDYPF